MKQAPGSSETSALTRATRRNNPEDTILQTSWPLVRKRTIPTDRPPLVNEIYANFCGLKGVAWYEFIKKSLNFWLNISIMTRPLAVSPRLFSYFLQDGKSFIRYEVFTVVTMKNALFWNIRSQFVPHRRHITSPLQSPASSCYVRYAVFTAVTMKSVVLWDITPCVSCKNQRFG
jgi:hypothetical protein